MKVVSSVDGSALLEVRLEGKLQLSPLEARAFLDALALAGLDGHIVVRVGVSETWMKHQSSVAGVAAFNAPLRPGRESVARITHLIKGE